MERFTDSDERFTITTVNRKDALMYMKAVDMSIALHEIREYLRGKVKYYEDGSNLDYDTLVKVQDDILDILQDNEVMNI